jgi:hypothetical protein
MSQMDRDTIKIITRLCPEILTLLRCFTPQGCFEFAGYLPLSINTYTTMYGLNLVDRYAYYAAIDWEFY